MRGEAMSAAPIFSNAHTHTVFCDGHNTVEENVLRALELGFVSLGFSIHSGNPYEGFKIENEEKYKVEVARIREIYGHRIEILCGIERDGFYQREFSGFEFMIDSTHMFMKDGEYCHVDHSEAWQAADVEKLYGGKYYVGELNNRPSKQVYMDTLGIRESDIATQTFKNPFGKIIGDDICIVSIKEVVGNGLACFRQVNDSDVLTLLELKDYKQVAEDTIRCIKNDFNHISGIFSVNCLFRYLLFSENNILNDYLKTMSGLGSYCGFMGYGEHYQNQFINQTMTCVVFE